MAERKTSTSLTTKSSSKEKQLELTERDKIKRNIKKLKKEQDRETRLLYHIMPGVLLFTTLFLVICFLSPKSFGILYFICVFLKWLFGNAIWAIPVCLAIEAFYWKQDYASFSIIKKWIVGAGCVLFTSILFELGLKAAPHLSKSAGNVHENFGGFIGMMLGGILSLLEIGAWIIAIFGLLIFAFAMFNITVVDVCVFIKNKIQESMYNASLRKQEKLEEIVRLQKEERKRSVSVARERSAHEEALDSVDMRKKRAFITEAEEPAGYDEGEVLPPEEIKPALTDDSEAISYTKDDSGVVDINIFDEIKNEDAEKVTELAQDIVLPEAIEEASKTDLSDIFTSDASIAIAGETSSAAAMNNDPLVITKITNSSEEAETESINVDPIPVYEEVYHFPPINFLQPDPNPSTFAVTDELKQTSIKLVETLKNFGVKTKIMNICCGPTVTRYELQPEVGVRVRSIANLADDIALHLAANGVRIEAPIPGKDAVGIEVPNKTVSTVYIRNLIESVAFENQKGKLTVALGMDVAGSPVYMNVAKMPHLLIAGATGMGKSVCINTFIVSMLYKAKPDEVKFILIDPKKVELSIYNGLPHLLVPVVSDPKKAAGSLAWAVNEMERRFLLIEEVGVRDIDTYNEVTRDDPEKEYMPKIVIIIDELADLMMTARDEVETSICRLAQKARAAGMHLVIGTQRPSVDVITGLIKANVPSRIACTVASQVDSRTIIDVSGAEKLLGRGDMLYAPVGCMKPMRVQGSFVSEKEIENIVEFLKNGKKFEYDADIIESIEREAARCGEKKKGKGGMSDSDDFEGGEDRASIIASDDAVLPAIEIAVDSGSVSTSLLQRKLSLGYARAARIVDKLEKIGVVGPFEGSKPRKVLITREEYLEMRMNYEGTDE